MHTILDTGPLVAFLSEGEAHHDWANEQFGRLKPPLLTCDAVLSEACFLLRSSRLDAATVLDAVNTGIVRPVFSLADEAEPVRRMMRRYANIDASLADICLVRMSEIYADCKVLTLDRDFLVYRRDGRRVIPLIAPFDG